MTVRYLHTPDDVVALVGALRSAGRFGWDTETYGHNVRETSPAHRARVDVWSVAVATRSGVRGAVLSGDTLRHVGKMLNRGPLGDAPECSEPTFCPGCVLGDPRVEKIAHNARHDVHAAANAGVAVRGVTDTLEWARLVWPGRTAYNLKTLARETLGHPARETFADLTAPEATVVQIPTTRCACGDPGCRKKTAPHAQFPAFRTKTVTGPEIPVESIGPDHPRWARKLAYAAADAVDALALADVARARAAELDVRLPALPW